MYYSKTNLGSVIIFFMILGVESSIVQPCKVQNLVTQPKYGTSLTTKNLVNIVQMPPVFVQNVMVGVCENRNQQFSSGKIGEFYTCLQRYTSVEVYTAESTPENQTSGSYNEIRFNRESVIIESGCDLIFIVVPISQLYNMEGSQRSSAGSHPTTILRSPFHPNIPASPTQVPAISGHASEPIIMKSNVDYTSFHGRADGTATEE